MPWLALLATCSTATPATPTHRVVGRVAIADAKGISDLTPDGHGNLFAVPERDRQLLQLDPSGVVIARYAIRGVPPGVDTEAVAVLDDGRLAFGTERQDEELDHEVILIGERGPTGVVIREQLALPHTLVGGRGGANHGVEGLCAAGPVLVAGLERRHRERPRFAPVALYEWAARRWTAVRVPLTTERGKLSGLFCLGTPRDGSLDVLVIERDYGVGRVLRARLPVAGGQAAVEVVAELAASFTTLPNFEGVVQVGDELYLINDNDSGGSVHGLTELVHLAPLGGAP